MHCTTKWLATIFTNNQGLKQDHLPFLEVTTDSRVKTNNALFIPLVGENFDGHEYLKQAVENGAIATMWNEDKQLPTFLPTDFPVFFVHNTLDGLQELASQYRDEINPVVVGITGSNGKTTTKDLVASVLKTQFKTHFTLGNLNNHIGLPLTILGMPKETEVLVVEMGMNHFKEIDQLSMIAKPDYAIITNIGESHIENLGSRKGIAKAKLEILNGMDNNGMLIIDGDEKLLDSFHKRKNVITCGYEKNNDVVIDQIKLLTNQSTFHLADGSTYTIPLLGKHHAQNATYAIIIGSKLSVSNENIKKGLLSTELTSMRFELLKGLNDVSIINDTYNASPTSMKAAIDVVKQMKGFKKKVLILGDIFELGEQSAELHASIAKVIDLPITTVYTYGNAAKNISSSIKEHKPYIMCNHFDSKEDLLKTLQIYLHKNSLLLFKASRGMHFETLVEAVQKDPKVI